MFDSPLVWCAVVKGWVALDENVSTCRKMQDCDVAVCPKSHLFVAAASAAQQSALGACSADSESETLAPRINLRIS